MIFGQEKEYVSVNDDTRRLRQCLETNLEILKSLDVCICDHILVGNDRTCCAPVV